MKSPKNGSKSKQERKNKVKELKTEVIELKNKLENEIRFYRGLNCHSISLDVSFEVKGSIGFDEPANEAESKENEQRISEAQKEAERKQREEREKETRIENEKALLIQTIWRQRNQPKIKVPDLNTIFDITYEDYQKAELNALRNLADKLFSNTFKHVIGIEIEDEDREGNTSNNYSQPNIRGEEEEEEAEDIAE